MNSSYLLEIFSENQNLWLHQARLALTLVHLYNSWQRKLSSFCSLVHDLITGQNSAKMEMVHRSLLGEYKGRNHLFSFTSLDSHNLTFSTFPFPPDFVTEDINRIKDLMPSTGPLPLLQIHKSHVLRHVHSAPMLSNRSEWKYMLGDALTYQGQSKSHSHIPYLSWFTGHASAHAS